MSLYDHHGRRSSARHTAVDPDVWNPKFLDQIPPLFVLVYELVKDKELGRLLETVQWKDWVVVKSKWEGQKVQLIFSTHPNPKVAYPTVNVLKKCQMKMGSCDHVNEEGKQITKGPRKQGRIKQNYELVMKDEFDESDESICELSPLTDEQYCFIIVHSSMCTLKWIHVFGHWYFDPSSELVRKFGDN